MSAQLRARALAQCVAFMVPFGTSWSAAAQCSNQSQSLGTSPLNGAIHQIGSCDPDGPGPRPARLVVGGGFTRVHGAPAGGVAVWDPLTSSWSALAGGTDGLVNAVAGLPNGDLIVAGPFTAAGGRAAAGIARFNGVTWAPLGAGLTNGSGALNVKAVVALPNGDVAVAGNFTAAGGQPANGLARFAANAWSAIPATLSSNGTIGSLVALPGGDLVVGGTFTSIGGVATTDVARWNGTTWAPLGAGLPGGVSALAVTGNGSLIAAGAAISRWNGAVWTPIARLIQGTVNELVGLPGDGVVAGGSFTAIDGTAAVGVAAWNGVAWSPLGAIAAIGSPWVDGLAALPNGQLFAVEWSALMQWDGSGWRAINPGVAAASALLAGPGDEVFVGGSIVTQRGIAGLARRDGATWTPIDGAPVAPLALARRPNGGIVAAGNSFFREWDGTSWSAPGGSIGGTIRALIVLPGGDVIAGGDFMAAGVRNVGRWNGTRWSALGTELDGPVQALALLPNGDVVVGGSFISIGGVAASGVARWDGVRWTALGAGLNSAPSCFAVAANGDLYAGGAFTTAGGAPAPGVARWNGTAWSPVGAGSTNGAVLGATVVPNGDLIVVGQFTTIAGVAAQRVARFDGVTWRALGAGLTGDFNPVGRAVAFGARGLYVAGSFDLADGVASTNVALLASTCPAAVQPAGAGCFGRTLTVSAPWLGSTLRTEGRSLGGPAIAALVTGFAPLALPLNTVLPTALPGCTLSVQPDLLAALPVNSGIATASVVLPTDRAFAGIVLRQQMVAFESGGALAVTATNAVALTLGAY